MADGVNYDVNAILRTSGSFTKDASMAATAADSLGSAWGRMGDRLVSTGERVRGTFGGIAKEFIKGGGVAIGGALVAGIGAATAKGVEFNNTMEQGAIGLATMYQTFGVNPAFDKNIELAKAMQNELIGIAEASPGTTADIMEAYQALAPGVTGVTQDLMRQRDLMEKIAVLGFTTGGDYKQLGADVGRIVSGVAGADVSVFRTLAPTLKQAFADVTGKEVVGDFAQEWNKVAKQNGELALTIFEKAISGMGPEVNAAFGQSFGGVVASFQSKLMKVAGDFSKPLFDSVRDVLNEDVMGGVFGGEGFGKLREVAFFAGDLLAGAFEKGSRILIRGVDYIANNWEDIAKKIQQAGVAAGLAIKTALVVGMVRHATGSAMIFAGKIATAFDKMRGPAAKIGKLIGGQIRATHIGIARGMKGGGAGMTGAMGRGLKSVFGKLDGSKSPLNIFRGFDKGILKITSLVTVIGTLGTVAAGAVFVLGGLGVAVAGIAAYFVAKWDEISGSLVRGLEDGTITLQPLITSAYTFWIRLQMVGEALLGNMTAADMASGGLGMLTTAMDVATSVLGPFIYALSIMVGAWGALKLGMVGVLKLIEMIVSLGVKLKVVDESVLTKSRARLDDFNKGITDTFTQSEKLARASEAISSAQLTPLDYEKAKAKAAELEKSLSDALTGGAGAGGKGGKGRATKPRVKIDKVVVEVKTDDPDPDRLFGSFLPKMMSLADKRVQAYDTFDVGD